MFKTRFQGLKTGIEIYIGSPLSREQKSEVNLPVKSGNFCSSRFFDILNLELLCRLSFLITGPPGWYLILFMSVGGGGALTDGGPLDALFACKEERKLWVTWIENKFSNSSSYNFNIYFSISFFSSNKTNSISKIISINVILHLILINLISHLIIMKFELFVFFSLQCQKKNI